MARSRVLRADFFRSRSIAKCSIAARLTYQGLWVEADDKGRGLADPRVLKGTIWPLDDDVTPAVIASHVCELARTGHIRLYTCGEDILYHVIQWDKHQAAAYRRGEARYPDPADSTLCTLLHADECKSVLHLGVGLEVNRIEAAALKHTETLPPAVDNCGAADAADFDQFDQAVTAALAVRRAQSTVTDERRWTPAARNGIIADYGRRIRNLLDEGHTPRDAGEIALGRPAFTPGREHTPVHDPSCICDGTGWLTEETDGSTFVNPCQAEQTEATIHPIRGATA